MAPSDASPARSEYVSIGPFGSGTGRVFEELGRMADAVASLDQLRLAPVPGGVAGLLLAQLDRSVTDVDDEAERTLPERLRRSVRRGHDDLGSRRTEPAFEEPTDAWRIVGNAHEPGDLGGQTHEVQRLRSTGVAESGDIGDDAEHVELDRQAIRWMVRSIVREPLVGDVVELLDRLERFDQVVSFDRFWVEDDDEAADDGVDLGPFDTVESLDGCLRVSGKRGMLRPVGSAHLNVGMTVTGHRHTAVHTAFGVPERPHAGP